MTFWDWCSGKSHSQEWQDICVKARQLINSFLEMTALHGRLNPATFIFLSKNWLGYSDKQELDVMSYAPQLERAPSYDAIKRYRCIESEEDENGRFTEKG